MKYTLYGVEVPVCSSPLTYELVTRIDEGGPGSPLVWAAAQDAQKFIDQAAREAGDPDIDMRVVLLSGETASENEGPFDGLFGDPAKS